MENQDDSSEVFTNLYKETERGLYSLALKMERHQQDAEDLVQDTVLRAYRFFYRFERGTNFSAWIFRILTNNYINEYRKKNHRAKRGFERYDSENIWFSLQAPSATFWEELDQRWNRFDISDIFDDEIVRAINLLPEHYRTPLILCDLEDHSYNEIAVIIECPIGTVMSRLNRGRGQMQRRLKYYANQMGYIN